MEIQLEGGTLEEHYGRNVDKAPKLLARLQKGEGYIPSEADIRLLGIRNFKNAPAIATNYWGTSTLPATKGDTVKVILPYETGSRTLTEAARFGLALINPNESLVSYGVNLDIEGRWDKLEGEGVYTKKRNEWFEKGEEGVLVGLNKDMKEEQAMRCPILLTKLGHPDYVDGKFARSADEVVEIIGKTFKLGKQEHGYDTMLGQFLPDVSDKGILKAWYVLWLGYGSRSGAWSYLGDDYGRFAFYSVGDAENNNAEGVDVDRARVQLQTLEEMLKPEQINQIGAALNERDELRRRLLTSDQIYLAVKDYVDSANESEVRKILDGLTKR